MMAEFAPDAADTPTDPPVVEAPAENEKPKRPAWDAQAVLLTYDKKQKGASTQGPLGALPARDLTGQEVVAEIRDKATLTAVLETGLYTAPDPLPAIPWPPALAEITP